MHWLGTMLGFWESEFVVLFAMKEKYNRILPLWGFSFRSASDNLTINETTSPSMLRAHAHFLESIPQHLKDIITIE
jgi:hypothetical protein